MTGTSFLPLVSKVADVAAAVRDHDAAEKAEARRAARADYQRAYLRGYRRRQFGAGRVTPPATRGAGE